MKMCSLFCPRGGKNPPQMLILEQFFSYVFGPFVVCTNGVENKIVMENVIFRGEGDADVKGFVIIPLSVICQCVKCFCWHWYHAWNDVVELM